MLDRASLVFTHAIMECGTFIQSLSNLLWYLYIELYIEIMGDFVTFQ